MKKLLLLVLLFTCSLAGQLSAQAQRKVLVEDFTGRWCGFCPYGINYLDQIDAAYPNNSICIGLHGPTMDNTSGYYDVMACNYSLSMASAYSISEWPSILVDRAPFNQPDGSGSSPVTLN